MNKKITPTDNSPCLDCLYFDSNNNICVAFPLGIPQKYLTGGNKHHKPDLEQVVPLVFEPKLPEY